MLVLLAARCPSLNDSVRVNKMFQFPLISCMWVPDALTCVALDRVVLSCYALRCVCVFCVMCRASSWIAVLNVDVHC